MNPKKILIAEDDEVIRRYCARLLSGLMQNLLFAESVEAAVQIIEKESPDLLITDLRLPDGDGSDIILLFKEKFPANNVIIISGYCESGLSEKVDRASIFSHICKPFDKEELEKAVRDALQTTRPDEGN